MIWKQNLSAKLISIYMCKSTLVMTLTKIDLERYFKCQFYKF